MSNPEIDLAKIGDVLNRHDVDYVIVGGVAVVLQGGEAATVDVDIAFDRSGQNIERLANALEELSARPKRWAAQGFRLQSADLGSKWVHLDSDFGDIDLIAEIPGISYGEIKGDCDQFDIEGTKLPVASVKELIAMKSSTGRAKDAIHVEELKEILRLRDEP